MTRVVNPWAQKTWESEEIFDIEITRSPFAKEFQDWRKEEKRKRKKNKKKYLQYKVDH